MRRLQWGQGRGTSAPFTMCRDDSGAPALGQDLTHGTPGQVPSLLGLSAPWDCWLRCSLRATPDLWSHGFASPSGYYPICLDPTELLSVGAAPGNVLFCYSKSPTYEQVLFQECVCKSNLFAKSNKVSLGTQLTQSAI